MINLRKHDYHFIALIRQRRNIRVKKMGATSTTISFLADYRERTAGQRRFEEEEYHTIVDNLPMIRVEYEGRVLTVHYDGSRNTDLMRRIRQNPAWGLRFFGVVCDICLGELIVTVNVPDKIVLQKRKIGEHREVLAVTFLTQSKNSGQKIVWDIKSIRRRPRPIYTFR